MELRSCARPPGGEWKVMLNADKSRQDRKCKSYWFCGRPLQI